MNAPQEGQIWGKSLGVKIVTDTSCDLPTDLEKEILDQGTRILPFYFHFGLEQCIDKSIPMQEFIARTKQRWPTTAAPSVGAYVDAFETCLKNADQVLCLTITSRYSSSLSAATAASQEFPPGRIALLDSESLSLGQGLLVLAAARAAREGRSLSDITEFVRSLQKRLSVFLMLETVQYLVKGGRANHVVGTLAGLLHLRPILTFRNGELVLIQRPRGRKTAKEALLALARNCMPAEMFAVGHIACEAEAKEFASDLAAATGFPREKILLSETGLVLAAHGGPGVIGFAAISQEQPG